MPTKTKKTKSDIATLIKEKLKDEERTLMWLARKTGISYGHLYYCISKRERDLGRTSIDKINAVLSTNF